MRIYQIPAAIRMCFDEAYVDEDGVFHFDETSYAEVCETAEAKIANTVRYIREQEHEIAAMKKAANEILERAKSEQKKLDRLEAMTISALEALGKPIKKADIRASITTSFRVEVDESILHNTWYRTKPAVKEPNLQALRDALKQGVEINGARLVAHANLSFK